MSPEDRRAIVELAEKAAQQLPGFLERVEKECPDLLAKAGDDIATTSRALGRLFGFTPKPQQEPDK